MSFVRGTRKSWLVADACFDCSQNSPISETKEFKRKFYQDCKTKDELKTFKARVYAYRGVVEDGFMDVDKRKLPLLPS